jgi:hypothetical protein
LGEKRFRALQTDKDAPLNAAQSDARAPPRPASGATETNMTICTSSSIRTLTVGSGFSPDLLTPRGFRYTESQMNAGARGLTGSRFRVAGIPPVGNFTPP